MSWTERLNETLPCVQLGTAVVDIHEWSHWDQPLDGPLHRHSHFVVCRVEGGEGEFTAGERRHRVGPGDLLFARPGVRHSVGGAAGFRLSRVAFEVTPGTDDDDINLVLQRFIAADLAVVRDAGPVGLVWELLKESARGAWTPGQKASVAALAPALLVGLARAGGGDVLARKANYGGNGEGFGAAVDSAEALARKDGQEEMLALRDISAAELRADKAGSANGAEGSNGNDGIGSRAGSVNGANGYHHSDGEAPATPEPTPDRHLRAVRMAVRYISDNLDRPLRVEELAKQVNVSPRQLTRLFATILNEPPASYVERVRLERAAELLANTQTPIKQIATDLGYPDVPTFTRAFTRQHQSPPGRFRRAANGGKDLRAL